MLMTHSHLLLSSLPALEMHEGETTAPPMLTEAELIRKMDDNGIGTDATIATHIQTIQVHHNAAVVGLPSLSDAFTWHCMLD